MPSPRARHAPRDADPNGACWSDNNLRGESDCGRRRRRLEPGTVEEGCETGPTDTAVVIAGFNTHLNTRAEGYSPEPSPLDKHVAKYKDKVPEIIRTHEGITVIPYR